MSTPNPTLGQSLLSMIESDLATLGGQPLLNLLTALQASKGNVLLQQAAILQFVATAPGVGIQLGVQVEQQLLQLAIDKVSAFISSRTSNTKAA